MENKSVTAVLFRLDRDNEVVAVFPEDPADHRGNMTCYSHVGQHSGCSSDWIHGTRPAAPDEYSALKAELESIGYTLKVYKRATQQHRAKFRAELIENLKTS